jgi:hypothetical protein
MIVATMIVLLLLVLLMMAFFWRSASRDGTALPARSETTAPPSILSRIVR